MDSPAPRIYLDNAATSWPKPPEVIEAIQQFYSVFGAAAHRGAAGHVGDSNCILNEARKAIAQLLNASEARQIVFTANATDALNLAIHGVVRNGQHVVTSVVEHNSILRPLRRLSDKHSVSVSYVGCDRRGQIDLEQLAAAITPATRLVCLSYVSNVTGIIQPVKEIAAICKDHEALLLIDAAQAAGIVEIDIESIGCDLLASAGHKGLLGPLGTGFLYVGPRAEDEIEPIRQGGTGSHSEDDRQPRQLPDRLECGNPNVGGIAGLLAAVNFIQSVSQPAIRERDGAMSQQIRERFAPLAKITTFPSLGLGAGDAPIQTEIVSFTVDGVDCHTVASILDSSFDIQVRAGLHCAPRMHKQLGTLETGGTVRASPGFFNTIDEIDIFVDAIAQISNAS